MKEETSKLGSLVLCIAIIVNLAMASSMSNLSSKEFDGPLANSPKTIWVDDDFVDDPPNHKWDTVQEGVYDAAKGDTVYVFNGTYYENVQVSVPISLMGEDWRRTIIDGGGSDEVVRIWVESVHISGFTITNGGSGNEDAGIHMNSNNNNISGNFIDSNDLYGINLDYSNGNMIANNIISNNEAEGIRITGSSGNAISGNIIDSNDQNGIESVVSNDNLITKNNISNNEGAIFLDRSDRNIVANNHISSNDVGISIEASSQNTISDNVMLEDGILVRGHLLEYWNTHTIDTSNTVNGKPVYYWKNVTGGAIPAGAGQVILANCTDVVIENQNVSNGDVGIQLGFSSHITIANNTASSNDLNGIRVSYSENTAILDNTALDNYGAIALFTSHNNSVKSNHVSDSLYGVFLASSSDNNIVNNSVSSSNRYGITVFSSSSHNTISNNLVSNNSEGVHIVLSHNNTIYHNNLIDNQKQAYDGNPEDNNWHNPTLLEGNYWSDYTGVDDGSGTGKHAIVGDGIGDTLIPHPGTDFDFYPFTEPGGWEIPPNRPPVAEANGPYFADEGMSVMLNGSGSNDPDNDILQYRWDLDNDGVWDTGWSSSPHMAHTWGDDYSGEVVIEVWDGELTDTDTAYVTVNNVAPIVEFGVLPISVNVSLRIAGEKWHDVSVELYENGLSVADGNLTRYPGSPNDQMLDLTHLKVNISRNYSAIVRYTPEDDPVNGQPNGANPCWIILTFNDGEEFWIHHTFNVQHPETHIWEVDLTRSILFHGFTFEATAYDPGADDLTFIWDFGDGTNVTSFHPNTNETYPVIITETITHAFPGSGTYTVTVTVEDDDGGKGAATFAMNIP